MKEYRKFHASVADLCLRTLRVPLFFLGLMLFFMAFFKVFLLIYLVPSPAFAVEMMPDVLKIETEQFSADFDTEHLIIGELDRSHLHGAHLHGALLDNAHLGKTHLGKTHLGGTTAIRMTDSVHVSLYHAQPPGSLKIVTPDSPVLLSLDGQRIQLLPNQVIEVTASNRSILVRVPEAGNGDWSDGGSEAEQTIRAGSNTQAGSAIRAGSTIRGASLRVQNHQPEALLKLITEEHGYRNYHGRLTIEAVAQSPADRLRIVNVVDLEDYVASVVGSEMQSNQHEALKAQAVIARTYALRTMHEAESGQSRGSGSDTYQPYIFTDDEQYQVYLGEHISKPHYSKAANDTRSEVLTWSGQLILTPFFSTCGGSTSPNEDVWQGSPRRYLRAVQDNAVCDLSPHFTWSLDVYKEQLSAWVEDTFGVRPESFRLDYDEGRRVRRVHLVSDGGEKTITGNDLRLMVNDRLHKLAMKSTRFTWEERPGGVLHIRGIGLGHGVGLCQYGAMGLAASGWVYDDILRFYFSGTKVVHLQSEEGQRLTFD